MIELRDIVTKFNTGTPDEVTLFDNFNFKVNKGDFVSVIGSNGSGKTTMLNIICGTLKQNSGKILLEGKDISNMPQFKRAEFIGRVFQDTRAGTCSDLTILENMALADNKHRAFSLTPAINKKRIDHYRTLLETVSMGLEDRMHVKTGSLSGGQRQALAMLTCAMSDIDLLILDEHTAALDPKSSETIMQITDKIYRQKNITTVMVTHNLRHAVEYGNRLVMMDKGNIIMDKSGDDKNGCKVEEILSVFNEISIECGN